MTQWVVRSNLKKNLARDVRQWAVIGSLRRVLAGGCDAMGGERQFKEGFGGRM